jgi:VIT1/CCC1 family predicted Fe2+/Mn2+ transporter
MKVDLLLATFANLGVALAGFSGIVVAVGGHARGEWSSRDRYLLTALLTSSGGSTLLSVLPLMLASAPLAEPTIWVVSSASAVVLQVGLLAVRARKISREADTRIRERFVLVASYGGGAAFMILQLVNCFWLRTSWPHLATIAWHLAISFTVFVRLVLPSKNPVA